MSDSSPTNLSASHQPPSPLLHIWHSPLPPTFAILAIGPPDLRMMLDDIDIASLVSDHSHRRQFVPVPPDLFASIVECPFSATAAVNSYRSELHRIAKLNSVHSHSSAPRVISTSSSSVSTKSVTSSFKSIQPFALICILSNHNHQRMGPAASQHAKRIAAALRHEGAAAPILLFSHHSSLSSPNLAHSPSSSARRGSRQRSHSLSGTLVDSLRSKREPLRLDTLQQHHSPSPSPVLPSALPTVGASPTETTAPTLPTPSRYECDRERERERWRERERDRQRQKSERDGERKRARERYRQRQTETETDRLRDRDRDGEDRDRRTDGLFN
ncbi:hypothetical protein BJ742DRAFT_443858 [Cladochytrium replicatum]|nr:hypothetical protein BJ742DRAFT_443858 [Cladochytrium replicatum]